MGHNLAMPPSDSEANGTDRDVLTSLPRTRPARRSAKRDRPGRAGGGASTASRGSRASASPGASTASGKAASAKAATTGEPEPTSARAKPEAASPRAKPKDASPRSRTATPSRTRAATSRAAARPTAAAQGAAHVPAASAVPPAGYATEAPAHRHGVPDPFAVATTAVQAAGEIAQIGATLWGQAVRSAISRLPRP